MLELFRKNSEGTFVIFLIICFLFLKGKNPSKQMPVNSAAGTAQKRLGICILVREMTSALLKALHHQTTRSKTRPDAISLCVLLLIATVPVSEQSTFSSLSSRVSYSRCSCCTCFIISCSHILI